MTDTELRDAADRLRASAAGYTADAVATLRAAAAEMRRRGRNIMAASLEAESDRLDNAGSAYLGRAATMLERAAGWQGEE